MSAVMYGAASEQTNKIVSAISSGSAIRPIGVRLLYPCNTSGGVSLWNAVSTTPGEIDKQRIPWLANSRAIPIVMVSTAPLDEA